MTRKKTPVHYRAFRPLVSLWTRGMLVGGAFLVAAVPSAGLMAAAAITREYTVSGDVSLGSLVSLDRDTSNTVEPATSTNADSIFGVVVNPDNSPLTLINDQDNQVPVATSGTAQVLVSTINGDIKRGDHITASPISGVGMKATTNVRVIGTAQSDMRVGKQTTYKSAQGVENSVTIGDVPVLINVAYYFKEPERTIIPSGIQNVANAFAGREVSTLPIVLSAAIFIVTIAVVSSIIYSMIRSSIISVGRNPMSQGAIYRNLIQLTALVLVILTVGFSSIYLVLTRL